jgi:hypothetical protein
MKDIQIIVINQIHHYEIFNMNAPKIMMVCTNHNIKKYFNHQEK